MNIHTIPLLRMIVFRILHVLYKLAASNIYKKHAFAGTKILFILFCYRISSFMKELFCTILLFKPPGYI